MDGWQQRLGTELAGLGVELEDLKPLHGGACQENFAIRCVGGERFALRSDAQKSLPGSLDRRMESEVVRVACGAGVPTPAVRLVLPDLIRPGSTAYVMDWAEGVAIAAKIHRDPSLAKAREGLVAELAAALASVHSVRPESAPLLRPNTPQDGLGGDPVGAALGFCRAMMDRLSPRPALERVFGWLDGNRPDPGPLVLVHGDYRVGNFLVTGSGLSAVLDWEFAHWGSAAEDLAWITVRDWRFGRPDRAVGGLGTRAEFLAAYRAAGGVQVSAEALRWFEVLGNLRWATGAIFQAQRVLSGTSADLELLAIGRRAAEMEWEALRVMGSIAESHRVATPAVGPVSVDEPDVAVLLGGLGRFLGEAVVPAIADRGLGFRVRIAAHLAGVAAREAVLGESSAGMDLEDLVELGLAEPTVGAEAVRSAVWAGRAAWAEAIRQGRADLALTDRALQASLGRQLAISNPRFGLAPHLGDDPWIS